MDINFKNIIKTLKMARRVEKALEKARIAKMEEIAKSEALLREIDEFYKQRRK